LQAIALLITATAVSHAQGLKNWTAPRTAYGHPDLQGIWTNATLTPLQRPADLAGKQVFTTAEAAAYEKQRLQASNVDSPESRRAGDRARGVVGHFH